MPRVHILERSYSSRVAQVDREAGVIRGVKILGRTSANDREYSDAALQQAAQCYEGLGVNMNHPDRRQPSIERPVQDGFGWLESVHVEPDGVYGDLHFLKSHPLAGPICEAAERRPDRFGLSHNATGNVVARNGKKIVESIEQVRSVDIVQRPATTQGLFESTRDPIPTNTDLSTATLTTLRTNVRAILGDQERDPTESLLAIADLLEQFSEPESPSSLDSTVQNLEQELRRARTEIEARELLSYSGLAVTPIRLQALVNLTESTARQELVNDWLSAGPGRFQQNARPKLSPPASAVSPNDASRDASEMARRFNT